MKYSILLLSTFFLHPYLFSQTSYLKSKEIKVGNKMPDIALGTVMNNKTGKTRFSEFEGKLVILDFWHTSCSSCLAGFPKMEMLQKKFGDKIQVFLVNPYETEKQIKNKLNSPVLKKYRLPSSLPIITNAKKLFNFFPGKSGIGYQIWIDSKRIVRLRGFEYNAYEEKIRELLQNDRIEFIKDEDVFQKEVPLITTVVKKDIPILQYSSMVLKFSDEIGAPSNTNIVENKIDSFTKTIRNTYANSTILNLYIYSTKKYLDDPKVMFGRRTILLVNDTSQYSDEQGWYGGVQTDRTIRKSRFSYEQIVPISFSKNLQSKYMLEDLNRFFSVFTGVEGKIEKRKINCYLLIRTSKEDKIKTQGLKSRIEYLNNNGNDSCSIINYNFVGFEVRNILRTMAIFAGLTNNDILIDETGYTGHVDLMLPAASHAENINQFRKTLQQYGLDIIKGEREISMLVLEEKNYQSIK
jgi:thiol-disulfide isomerase/thioredoxin